MENKKNIVNFIKSVTVTQQGPEDLRSYLVAQIIWSLLGLAIGCISGGYWKIIGIIMLLTSILTIFIGCVILSYKFTIKIRLMAYAVSFFGIELQLILFSSIIYTLAYGINKYLLVFIFAPILLSISLCIMMVKKIKSDKLFDMKETNKSTTKFTFAMCGIWGINFGRTFLNNIEQETATIIVLLIILLLLCIFSTGVFHVLRLYYFFKCKKHGISLE